MDGLQDFRKSNVSREIEKMKEFVYTCEKCGTEYTITDPGKYQCQICNNVFTVEDQEQKQAEAEAQAQARQQAQEIQKRKQKVKKIKIICSIGISLYLVVFFVFINSKITKDGIKFFSQDGTIIGLSFLFLIFCLVLFNGLLFVSKEKPKTIYAICPNPKCNFEGYIQLKTTGEMAKETFLLNLCNVGVIYTDSVICPKCGCRIR